MTKTYDHYPLVKKALLEQSTHFKQVPPEMVQATQRCLELIDTCIIAPDDFKESLMTVAVLLNCPPFVTLRTGRNFYADYSPHVSDMIGIHMHSAGVSDSNIDIIQVYSALFTAHGENLLSNLVKKDPPPDMHLVQDIREALNGYLNERKAYEAAIDPRLLAAETDVIKKTFTVLDAAIAKDTPTPNLPHRRAPKPPG